MGCRQFWPLSVVQLKGKHCGKPHCRNGVVDTFGLYLCFPMASTLACINKNKYSFLISKEYKHFRPKNIQKEKHSQTASKRYPKHIPKKDVFAKGTSNAFLRKTFQRKMFLWKTSLRKTSPRKTFLGKTFLGKTPPRKMCLRKMSPQKTHLRKTSMRKMFQRHPKGIPKTPQRKKRQP